MPTTRCARSSACWCPRAAWSSSASTRPACGACGSGAGAGRAAWGAGGNGASLFLPRAGEFIANRRLRDWLRLLSFEVEGGAFGCYRPALRSQPWLDRWGWMEKAGDRWWPMFGAVYLVTAVKRVRGMRLIGLARSKAPKSRAAPAVVSHRHCELHRDLRRELSEELE